MKSVYRFTLLLLIYGCGRGLGTDINEKYELDKAVARNMELPVPNVRYVVSVPVGICGNSSDAELRSIFVAVLSDEPYNTILKSRYPDIRFIDYKQADSLFLNHGDTSMYVEISGYRIDRDTVSMTESYRYAGRQWFFNKIGVYKKGGWSVLNRETEISGEEPSL